MNRNAWRTAVGIVSIAAVATTGWSLYAVARHYDAPELIGYAAVAVFDGAAYACLHLASEASAAGRSAIGPRLSALLMVTVSVYLNVTHANLIGGGLAAAVLFSMPTLALLFVSEGSWAGPRAAKRAELGEQPFRLPAYGGWAWLLAPARAGRGVKARAVDHIEHAGQSTGQAPDKTWTATDRLREHFATMDPAEAIRIAHESQPSLPPAELAALLVTYGVIVDAVQVALVLHRPAAEITVERDPDLSGQGPDKEPAEDPRIALARADMLSGQRPETLTDAVRELIKRGITDKAAVVAITRDILGPDTNPDSVRRTLTREIERAETGTPAEVKREGFYP